MSAPTLKKVVLDVDEVFKAPAADAREWLEEYNEGKGNGGGAVNGKVCPQCDEAVPALGAECPGCGADLRACCKLCSLPLSGEEPVCGCEGFETEEKREEFFSTSPRSREANRPGGGRGFRRLAGRRARYGY